MTFENGYEYPTEEQLEKIRKWDVLKDGISALIVYVKSLWWTPEWGWKLAGKQVLRLQLHCGGWSGNEDIIGALRDNYLFWAFCWVKSTRGGHYWFRINLKQYATWAKKETHD